MIDSGSGRASMREQSVKGVSLALACVLVLSALPYFVGFLSLQLVAPALLVLTGGWLLGKNTVGHGSHLRLRPTVFFLAIATLVPIASAATRGDASSAVYGTLFLVTLIAASVVGSHVQLSSLLVIYWYSGLVFVLLTAILGSSQFIQSLLGFSRFGLASFHPNLYAFVAGSYLIVAVYVAATRRSAWRGCLAAILAAVLTVLVWAPLSRGTLASLGVAAVFSLLVFLGTWFSPRRRPPRARILFTLLLVVIVAATTLILFPQLLSRFGSTLGEALAWNNPYRGVGTGLTGRIATWSQALDLMTPEVIAYGTGMRTSDLIVGASIDNGYLVLLFDTGVVYTITVLIALLGSVIVFLRRYFRERDSASLTAAAILVFHLSNNLVARYLWGLGIQHRFLFWYSCSMPSGVPHSRLPIAPHCWVSPGAARILRPEALPGSELAQAATATGER